MQGIFSPESGSNASMASQVTDRPHDIVCSTCCFIMLDSKVSLLAHPYSQYSHIPSLSSRSLHIPSPSTRSLQIPSLSTRSSHMPSPSICTCLVPGLAARTSLVVLRAHSQSQYLQPKHPYEGHLALCMSATASKAGACNFEAELINQHHMQGPLTVRAFHRVVCSEPSEKHGKGLLVGPGASALPKFLMTPSCLKLDAHSR